MSALSLPVTLLDIIVRCVLLDLFLLSIQASIQNFSTMGIAFNLILIRVGQQRAKQARHCASAGTENSEGSKTVVHSVETECAIFTDAI
jgi:hypothetical protein